MSLGNWSTHRPRRRLTTRLVMLLMILALLQMTAGGIPLLIISYVNQQASISTIQRQAAEKAALSIDAYLLRAVDRLSTFLIEHDREAILEGISNLQTAQDTLTLLPGGGLKWGGFIEVWVLDAQGQEVLQSSYRRVVDEQEYTSRADRPEYISLMEGQLHYIGSVRLLTSPGLPEIPATTIAVPIRIDTRVAGVLVGELDTTHIQEIIKELALGPGSYAYVVDQEGILRVHWEDTRIAVEERDLSNVPAVQAFLSNQQETTRYQGVVNEEVTSTVLGTWAPLQQTDWGVIVEQPEAEALKDLRRITIWLVILLVVAVLAAGGTGALLGRRLLRPLEVLREGAQQLAQGNLAHRIELHTGDETEILATTFNEMAERVQHSLDTIEAEVAERTQELSHAYEQLRYQSEEQNRLLETIRRMSTPAIPVLKGVMVMPLIGSIDSERALLVTEALLAGIEQHRAQIAILDITGVPVVDTGVANALLQAVQAASLLGVQAILVGITPEVAQTIVHLGVDLSQVTTQSTLQAGIEYAMRRMGRSI